MNLAVQKRLAGQIMKCSPKRVKFDTERLGEIKEAITKYDIYGLIKDSAITKSPVTAVSRGRARKRQIQRRKGRSRGFGNRKGKGKARTPKKEKWMNTVRLQREFLKELKDKKMLAGPVYRDLYSKSKGGFFRSKAHLKLFIEEYKLILRKK